jgi:hypothetical protein
METSQKLSLNLLDRKKIGKGALIAVIGVLLTYVADLIPTIDFGAYTPIVVAGFSVLANIVRKWIVSNQ